MDNYSIIQTKLEQFIKKYYTNELIKGFILFFAIGLLYFLFTLFIEYVLWLNPVARTILFFLFVVIEGLLLFKFMLLPLAKLFKLQKRINYKAASKIIGKHFPEVSDKLLNILQLKDHGLQSELLLASIEQKALTLKPIPFKMAVNFKGNLSYLKYAAIPVLILLITFLTDNLNWFNSSYDRVVHFKTSYEPPAPFQFFVVNSNLKAVENKDFKLEVKTEGVLVPDLVQIEYNDEIYFLKEVGIGTFEYVFTQPNTDIDFRLSANGVVSKSYVLHVMEVPSLLRFDMLLDYPEYTRKKDEVLKSTGNTIVPEGTIISWHLKTKSTDKVSLVYGDTIMFDLADKGIFKTSKHVFNNFEYSLNLSNKQLYNYESLAFRIDVVKDEYPEIDLKMKVDSLDLQSLYFYGQVSDDYGFSKVQLVYYPVGDESDKGYKSLAVSSSNISEFITAFPDNLDIKAGVPYELYFQVFDNDRVNKFKSSKSSVFSYRKRSKEEEHEKRLKDQSNTIKDLNKTLHRFKEQDKVLKELSRAQMEKTKLSFSDKKKLESFLKRQKQQDEMMKNFNKKFKDNLNEFEEDKEDAFKEDLEKRLEDNEAQLEADEKLRKELEELQDKINKESLIDKFEKLKKQNKNKKRSLQQLLELTKRFYVQKKLEKLMSDLEKLSEDQEKLSKESDEKNTSKKQEELNEKFKEFSKQLEALKKDSEALKKPIDIPQDKLEENEIKKEQEKALEALDKNEGEKPGDKQDDNSPEDKKQNHKNAQKSQKNAAKKMKEMAKAMQGSMQSGGGEQMQEDADMLRQILDNLLLYSFDQEALMRGFKTVDINHNKFAAHLRKQYSLKEHFEHIDDSLFALSLRQPKLSERVNKEISDVYFNIDKALELLTNNQLYQGLSKQHFAVTAANNLADILSNTLDNMQESMSMSLGQGSGDMQLPDIIMSQEQLNEMMKEGMEKGKEGGQKEDGEKKPGEDGEEGSKGEKGKDGSEEGENGEGKNGNKSGGEGEGSGDEMNGLLYQIYQQQQELRKALEDRLAKDGMKGVGRSLLKQMENIEMDLLNGGFTNSTLQKMMQLKHQLLKLENAAFEQGEDDKRESESNKNTFDNNSNNQIPTGKQYFNTTEILNRQALPLHQIYRSKVQEYFKKQ